MTRILSCAALSACLLPTFAHAQTGLGGGPPLVSAHGTSRRAKTPDPALRRKLEAINSGYRSVTRETYRGFVPANVVGSSTITITYLGHISVVQHRGTERIATNGRLTSSERIRLRSALHRADLRTLPDRIRRTGPEPADLPHATYRLTDRRGTKSVRAPGRLDGVTRARLGALASLLDAIEDRVARSKPATSNRDYLTIARRSYRGFVPADAVGSSHIVVTRAGTVRVVQQRGKRWSRHSGRLTLQEKARLSAAVRAADLRALPDRLGASRPQIADAPSATYTLRDRAGTKRVVAPGSAQPTALRALGRVLDAIEHRIVNDPPLRSRGSAGAIKQSLKTKRSAPR